MQTLKAFQYIEPQTVSEATRALLSHGAKAKLLAGGVDLVPGMRQRQVQPEYVVSLRRIPGLDHITDNGEGLRIGALATLRTIEHSAAIRKDYLLLYEAIHQIASTQVKTMGTAVGNLCVGTPASDVAVALLALGARLKIINSSSERVIPLEDFFIGVKQVALQPGDIVTEVLLPACSRGTGGAFLKLVRTAPDIAKVNVAVNLAFSGNTCQDARIALGSVAPTPIRAKRAEEMLKGKPIDRQAMAEAGEAAAAGTRPITDIRSTAEYRREVSQVLVRRAIGSALERARG